MTTLIRRSARPLLYRDRFGDWLFDWPDLFATVVPPRALAAEAMIDVEEFMDGDRLVIRAELPGIDPAKDVELTIDESVLHIRADRHQETGVEDRQGYRSELRYGAFTRSLPLPAGASEDDVEALYEAGILEIRVPVEDKKAATQIPIRGA
jgi:HSP20 family protein